MSKPKLKIIMNPPYDRNLHLKIADKMNKDFPEAEIVSLSPVRWLQDPLAEHKRSSDWQRFSALRDDISSIDIIPAKDACEIFNMTVSSDLGILSIDRSGRHYEDIRSPIISKIYASGDHFDKFDVDKKDGWRVRVSVIDNCKAGGSSKGGRIRFQRLLAFKDGLKDGKPWHSFFGKCGNSKLTDNIPYSLPFKSEVEAGNFISVMQSKLGQYYWVGMQQDIHVLPSFFLKLDYTHSWTDEYLYKHFNLTADEIKKIEDGVSK